MKRKNLAAILLILALVFAIASCSLGDNGSSGGEGGDVLEESLWDNATYKESTSLGEGAKTVTVSIEAEEKSVTLTVSTDKATLGEALFELEIIDDPSFFSTANGMLASWEEDHAYWAFYQGEEYMMVGVGDAAISGGESYRLVYTK